MNCKTCKHWKHTKLSWGAQTEVRVCDIISSASSGDNGPAYIEADAADDTGLTADLVTSPDFGCFLYEPATSLTPANG